MKIHPLARPRTRDFLASLLTILGALSVCSQGQETRRAEIVEEEEEEDDGATTAVLADIPETEELGTVDDPVEEVPLEDIPDPQAIPTEFYIPEPAAVAADASLPEVPQDFSANTSIVAPWNTQKDARTLLLSVPAPRGQIVDRNGYCIANNKVGFYYAVQFPRWEDPSDRQILSYTRQRIAFIDQRSPGTPWNIEDKEIIEHYKNRRWIPLLCPRLVRSDNWDEIQKGVIDGVKIQPTYYRSYPHNHMAAHFLGYVQKEFRNVPTGPILIGEPVTNRLVGRTGLEKTYDEYLTGQPGEINVIFDADGNKLAEEIRRNPTEGNHVVLTIEREFQEIAESILRSRTKAGAIVIMDVWDGDIIAMASHPSFDPNDFVPSISEDDYKEFLEDKRNPLFARAYQGQYPPASTFKVPVALALLESDKVGPTTSFNCTPYVTVGNRRFYNWHRKSGEGMMDIRRALKRSCNSYFYRATKLTGADPIVSMAGRLGFGEATGIPVEGEAAGRLPTHEWMLENFGYRIIGGALANYSIGQGQILATPLQIARAMCAVANGQYLPNARLVKHIQDLNGNIVEAFPIEQSNTLSVNPGNLRAVHTGMRGVVNDSDGTGKSANFGRPYIAGKTGTGQWSKTRNVALFAGFVPAENPEYAFVAVYEGSPGQGVSGGKQAAPLVASVFKQIYAQKRARGDQIEGPRGGGSSNRNKPDVEADASSETASASEEKPQPKSESRTSKKSSRSNTKPKSQPREVRKAQPATPPPPKKKEGLLRRIFKRR